MNINFGWHFFALFVIESVPKQPHELIILLQGASKLGEVYYFHDQFFSLSTMIGRNYKICKILINAISTAANISSSCIRADLLKILLRRTGSNTYEVSIF